MADLKVRSPIPLVGDPTNFPYFLLQDQSDGTYALKMVSSGTVAAKIRSPFASITDPTNFPLIGLVDNGDGTYSPLVAFV